MIPNSSLIATAIILKCSSNITRDINLIKELYIPNLNVSLFTKVPVKE